MDKFKSEKSSAEIEMEELLEECKDIVDNNYLTTQDARKLLVKGYKLLYKCEELRISRDNWKNKFAALNTTIVKNAQNRANVKNDGESNTAR